MKRLLWPGILIVLIASIVVMNVVMLIVASSDPSFAVDPAYYENQWRGGSPDGDRRLGWSAAVTLESAGDRALLRARVLDDDGQRIKGAVVTASVFHKAQASDAIEADLAPLADGGYVAPLKLDRPGTWACRLTVRRGGDTFVTVEEIEVAGPAEEAQP
jgi:nitrogen fixation protein FixH